MGGSGAGKSSLLAALIGQLPYSGHVFFDGRDVLASSRVFRDKVGFVPQNDALFEAMTVRENVQLAADLRIGSSTTARQRMHRVDAVLRDLQIFAVRHKKVSEISGGQRRRCSIAVELVCGPMILFLDEPTSGLDSESAHLVMTLLKELAQKKGQTVVAVIHQPSYRIFRLLDHVMVLRKGGKVALNGPGLGASASIQADSESNDELFVRSLPRAWTEKQVSNGEFEFLPAGENLADWLLERVEFTSEEFLNRDGSGPYELAQMEERLIEAQQKNVPLPAAQLSSKIYQFFVFSKQSALLLIRKPYTNIISFCLVVIAAVLLGVIFDSEHYVGPVDATAKLACPSWLSETCKLPQADPIVSVAKNYLVFCFLFFVFFFFLFFFSANYRFDYSFGGRFDRSLGIN